MHQKQVQQSRDGRAESRAGRAWLTLGLILRHRDHEELPSWRQQLGKLQAGSNK